jgi:hypothetical protein
MGRDWQELTKLVGQSPIEIERVRLVDSGVAIEGPFTLPPLAQLSGEDQVFVAAFVRCHGSIKQMEQYFGVSYHHQEVERSQQLSVEIGADEIPRRRGRAEVLERLSRGELPSRRRSSK